MHDVITKITDNIFMVNDCKIGQLVVLDAYGDLWVCGLSNKWYISNDSIYELTCGDIKILSFKKEMSCPNTHCTKDSRSCNDMISGEPVDIHTRIVDIPEPLSSQILPNNKFIKFLSGKFIHIFKKFLNGGR